MPITINQQLITAQTQTYKFENVLITKEISNNLNIEKTNRAIIQFGMYDENDKRIGIKTIEYVSADYNIFWKDFNTGKFLYDELNRKEKLSITVPITVENEFLN